MITFYYPQTLLNVTTALLDKFRGIQVYRYVKNSTSISKIIDVPITFSPIDKSQQARLEDYSQEQAGNVPTRAGESTGSRYILQVPRIDLSLTNIAYDPGRAAGVNDYRYFQDNTQEGQIINAMFKDYNPAPYNYTYTLYIKTDYMNDFAQIMENILPYFNPKLNLRVKEFSFLNLERDLQVTLENPNIDFGNTDLTKLDMRQLNGDISFVVEGFQYRPVTQAKMVKVITTKFFVGPIENADTTAETFSMDISAADVMAPINEFNLSGLNNMGDGSSYIIYAGKKISVLLNPDQFLVSGGVLYMQPGLFNISAVGVGISALSQCSDVNTGGVVSGDYLQFNGTQWVPAEVIIPPQIMSLSALTDVNTSGASAGMYLEYNGVKWVPSAITAGVSYLSALSDVSIAGLMKNFDLKWNGSKWVPALYNTSFTFSIASFTSNVGASTILIGTGEWKGIGTISFTASYNNGPATGGVVNHTGFTPLIMGGVGFVGPTVNASVVNYPGVGSSQSFQLSATDGTDVSTSTLTYTFWNQIFYGVSTQNGSFSQSDVVGLGTNYLGNTRSGVFTVNAGAGQYIVYAYPSRLGGASFNVGGFGGGFDPVQVVSITNANGFTESYNVYRSSNSGLGSTTVTVS